MHFGHYDDLWHPTTTIYCTLIIFVTQKTAVNFDYFTAIAKILYTATNHAPGKAMHIDLKEGESSGFIWIPDQWLDSPLLHFLLVVLKPPWKLFDVDNGDDDVCRLVLVLSKGLPLHLMLWWILRRERFLFLLLRFYWALLPLCDHILPFPPLLDES